MGFFRVGAAAAAAYQENREIAHDTLGLGGHAEVFDTEMAALAIGASKARELLLTRPNINQVTFFTDNSAGVQAMANPRPKLAQHFALNFHQTIYPLLSNRRDLSIMIAWCPSHCGIPRNERADQLAKEATDLERQTPFSISQANTRR